jgi:hypothetical protein
VLSLTPTDGLFTICLAAEPISERHGSTNPANYPWCESQLNAMEEYQNMLTDNTPGYRQSSTYQVLIKPSEPTTTDFILQFQSGNHRIDLEEKVADT